MVNGDQREDFGNQREDCVDWILEKKDLGRRRKDLKGTHAPMPQIENRRANRLGKGQPVARRASGKEADRPPFF